MRRRIHCAPARPGRPISGRCATGSARLVPHRRRPRLGTGADRGWADVVSLEQDELRADVAVVRTYGEAHPEAWVELRYENGPTVRIVALFSGDSLDVHERAQRGLVSYPDQLEVRPSPWTRRSQYSSRAPSSRRRNLLGVSWHTFSSEPLPWRRTGPSSRCTWTR